MLLAADLLPNTESKSTLRPVELGGWAAGGAENPVLEETRSDLKKKIKKKKNPPQAGSPTHVMAGKMPDSG